MRKVTDAFIDSIPNVINRTYEGVYGGVELNYPLTPSLLPSYQLKPYRLPNEVMIKLVFSVLSDDKKLEFAKQLEYKAKEDAYFVGEFVSSYLSDKSVNIIYFFGDLRTSEYGLIFKEYALKNDVKQIFFEEKEEQKIRKDAKTKITFEDAEKFLFALL